MGQVLQHPDGGAGIAALGLPLQMLYLTGVALHQHYSARPYLPRELVQQPDDYL